MMIMRKVKASTFKIELKQMREEFPELGTQRKL